MEVPIQVNGELHTFDLKPGSLLVVKNDDFDERCASLLREYLNRHGLKGIVIIGVGAEDGIDVLGEEKLLQVLETLRAAKQENTPA